MTSKECLDLLGTDFSDMTSLTIKKQYSYTTI